jgi:hypothetical protein
MLPVGQWVSREYEHHTPGNHKQKAPGLQTYTPIYFMSVLNKLQDTHQADTMPIGMYVGSRMSIKFKYPTARKIARGEVCISLYGSRKSFHGQDQQSRRTFMDHHKQSMGSLLKTEKCS